MVVYVRNAKMLCHFLETHYGVFFHWYREGGWCCKWRFYIFCLQGVMAMGGMAMGGMTCHAVFSCAHHSKRLDQGLLGSLVLVLAK